MRKLFFMFVLILLAACNFLSPPTPAPAETIVFEPSATPTIAPLSTPKEISLTFPPFPTTDPNFFHDEFIQTLDAQWGWIREDPRNWSLLTVPGSLQININDGYVVAHTNSNLLLRPAPAGDFLIETKMTFKPTDNFQFAGLIIYQSDSNFIQAGRAFCNAVGCAGEGLYMDYYRKGVIVKPNFGPTSKDIDPIWLRLSRNGETYNFEASANGEVWFIVDNQSSDLDPTQIGLITGQLLRGKSLPATFDYFEVRSLP